MGINFGKLVISGKEEPTVIETVAPQPIPVPVVTQNKTPSFNFGNIVVLNKPEPEEIIDTDSERRSRLVTAETKTADDKKVSAYMYHMFDLNEVISFDEKR
jgi:hypothetical protein